MVKLIVHVGHGKTGSSSIQKTLKHNLDRLREDKVKYLGLMLEHSDVRPRKDWQVETASGLFFDAMDPSRAQSELHDVLSAEMDLLTSKDYSAAIWSNEWIIERPQKILPVLKKLWEDGVDIELQAYVRRHDKWAVSAYTQWGIRHKSYEGPVMTFRDWASARGKRFAFYYDTFAPWLMVFGNRFRIMNFDSAGDVTAHFLQKNGIYGISTQSDNVSPSDLRILSAAVYNSSKYNEVPPSTFDRISDFLSKFDETSHELPPLDQLMPSNTVLQNFIDERQDDISKVNDLLRSSGEPPLSFSTSPRSFYHPSAWETDQMMMKYIFCLFEEVIALRQEIRALKKNEADDG